MRINAREREREKSSWFSDCSLKDGKDDSWKVQCLHSNILLAIGNMGAISTGT